MFLETMVESAYSRTWESGTGGKWHGGLERRLPEERSGAGS